MAVHYFTKLSPVGGVVLHHSIPVLFNEKGTRIYTAHKLHPAVPLAFIFDEFNGLGTDREAIQAGKGKEYGKFIRQVFLKLTIKGDKLLLQ
jgi:hypothetical protein